MHIDWDTPITMEDGLVLRADVFRPAGAGKYPVILSYGPYAKGLSFQEGYKGNWARLIKAAPEVLRGSSNKYQNWELVDPEKWVPDDLGDNCGASDALARKRRSVAFRSQQLRHAAQVAPPDKESWPGLSLLSASLTSILTGTR